MKIKDIRNFTDEELRTELERLRRHLFDVRAQAVTEKLEDSTQLAKAKRDIARLLTTRRQRATQAATTSSERK